MIRTLDDDDSKQVVKDIPLTEEQIQEYFFVESTEEEREKLWKKQLQVTTKE